MAGSNGNLYKTKNRENVHYALRSSQPVSKLCKIKKSCKVYLCFNVFLDKT